MTRAQAFEQLCGEYHGGKLYNRVSPAARECCAQFLAKHEQLGHLEFEYATNRLFLDANKPKGWLEATELLLSANSRVHMKGRK